MHHMYRIKESYVVLVLKYEVHEVAYYFIGGCYLLPRTTVLVLEPVRYAPYGHNSHLVHMSTFTSVVPGTSTVVLQLLFKSKWSTSEYSMVQVPVLRSWVLVQYNGKPVRNLVQ